MAQPDPMTEDPASSAKFAFRHRLSTRVWHWVNALTLLVLLMSGLTIFNAHPRLYWGEYGAANDPAWMAVGSSQKESYVRFGETRFDTRGWIGNWKDSEGKVQTWAFPESVTIPSTYNLADGRRWHFFFAWIFSLGLAFYMLRSLWNKHVARDLHMTRHDWSPKHILKEIWDHARLRFPKGEAALRYNSLQKLSYIGVIFMLLPLMIFTGITMSPGMDAAWPWLLDVFGGRQSARSLHFICAALLVLFVIVHLIMVLLAGPINHVRAMITGRYKLAAEGQSDG